jgi:hypothetical protein
MDKPMTLIMNDGSSRTVNVPDTDLEALQWWISNVRKPNPIYIEGVLYLRETVKDLVATG